MGVAAEWISNYKRTVEVEIETTCNDILSILASHLIPQSSTGEAKAFYMKMKGDYYRYSAEFKTDPAARNEIAEQANQAYSDALQQAKAALGAANPIRLGLALNYSVFFNEVMGSSQQAILLARKTCEEANNDIGNLDLDQQQDSLQIIQLLKNNLELWMSQAQTREDGA